MMRATPHTMLLEDTATAVISCVWWYLLDPADVVLATRHLRYWHQPHLHDRGIAYGFRAYIIPI